MIRIKSILKIITLMFIILNLLISANCSETMYSDKQSNLYCAQFTGFVSDQIRIFIKLDNETNETIYSYFTNLNDNSYKFNMDIKILDINKKIIYHKSINQKCPIYIRKDKNNKLYLQIVEFFKSKKNSNYRVIASIASDDDRFLKIMTKELLIEEFYDPAARPIEGLLRGGKLPEIPRKEVTIEPCKK